ncbi:NodT family efflux transporter outer membrane factor (OMF) lipoprotein [Herbaspirillum sp. Sphag1AN]|uniref:efflux transporter outer membrane subunit n=1 Tax=unclassified Herbaspirillum TaxID=2624150 RepID=UPI001617E30F|nr:MULTISPECIES: efflux transporter outer membrane subunit [unclassified Herbaspirillum]MBB3212252.1 NodT family efflux transporter outer membrane factor (OMF) lipoprotein [Herbaspirillum sp. Sphag1AN]
MMNTNTLRRLAHIWRMPAGMLAFCLIGCQATDYQRPSLSIPAEWQHARTIEPAGGAAPEDWWHGFADPVLLDLLKQVRLRNPDLETALLNVRKAQLSVRLSESDARPSLTGTVGMNGSRTVDSATQWQKSSSTSLSINYEFDLWGRIAAHQREAGERFIASRYDQQAARLLSDSTTASVYWDIAALTARLALSDRRLAQAQQTVALSKSRYQAGAIAKLEVLQSQRALLSQENSRRDLLGDLQQKRNALALLLNQPLADSLPDIPALSSTPFMQQIAAGLPSSLLERRPDLMAAEALLRATLVQVDQSKAAFFPTFSLTGTMGTSSMSLGNLLQNPVLALGGAVSMPFLNWQQHRVERQSRETDYELAVARFRKSLFTAYQEVDNALGTRARLLENIEQQLSILELSQQDGALSQRRYLAGEVAMQTWLNSIETANQAEETLLHLRLAQLHNLADLYKALGGPPQADKPQADSPLESPA